MQSVLPTHTRRRWTGEPRVASRARLSPGPLNGGDSGAGDQWTMRSRILIRAKLLQVEEAVKDRGGRRRRQGGTVGPSASDCMAQCLDCLHAPRGSLRADACNARDRTVGPRMRPTSWLSAVVPTWPGRGGGGAVRLVAAAGAVRGQIWRPPGTLSKPRLFCKQRPYSTAPHEFPPGARSGHQQTVKGVGYRGCCWSWPGDGRHFVARPLLRHHTTARVPTRRGSLTGYSPPIDGCDIRRNRSSGNRRAIGPTDKSQQPICSGAPHRQPRQPCIGHSAGSGGHAIDLAPSPSLFGYPAQAFLYSRDPGGPLAR